MAKANAVEAPNRDIARYQDLALSGGLNHHRLDKGTAMDTEEALAGEYAIVILVTIALWIAIVAAGLTVGGYFALGRLGL